MPLLLSQSRLWSLSQSVLSLDRYSVDTICARGEEEDDHPDSELSLLSRVKEPLPSIRIFPPMVQESESPVQTSSTPSSTSSTLISLLSPPQTPPPKNQKKHDRRRSLSLEPYYREKGTPLLTRPLLFDPSYKAEEEEDAKCQRRVSLCGPTSSSILLPLPEEAPGTRTPRRSSLPLSPHSSLSAEALEDMFFSLPSTDNLKSRLSLPLGKQRPHSWPLGIESHNLTFSTRFRESGSHLAIMWGSEEEKGSQGGRFKRPNTSSLFLDSGGLSSCSLSTSGSIRNSWASSLSHSSPSSPSLVHSNSDDSEDSDSEPEPDIQFDPSYGSDEPKRSLSFRPSPSLTTIPDCESTEDLKTSSLDLTESSFNPTTCVLCLVIAAPTDLYACSKCPTTLCQHCFEAGEMELHFELQLARCSKCERCWCAVCSKGDPWRFFSSDGLCPHCATHA